MSKDVYRALFIFVLLLFIMSFISNVVSYCSEKNKTYGVTITSVVEKGPVSFKTATGDVWLLTPETEGLTIDEDVFIIHSKNVNTDRPYRSTFRIISLHQMKEVY